MRSLSLALILSFAAAAHSQVVSDEEAKDGFVPLFNGKDFDGFRFTGKGNTPPKNWSVADGMIKLSGGGSPNLGTQWPYSDFDMRFQWKAHKKGYNSGFYVRSGRDVGANQINLAQNDAGHLMGGAKGGEKVPQLQKEPGEWNDWRVLAIGDKLTFWCNGKQAWEVTGFKPSSGHLGFQAEGAAIDFKNLRIKELGFHRLPEKSIAIKSDKDFVLRLEWQGENPALTLKTGKESLDLKETLAKTANPAKEWNYLEVASRKGQLEIWQNGETVRKGGPAAGELVVEPAAGVSVRNVRLQRND